MTKSGIIQDALRQSGASVAAGKAPTPPAASGSESGERGAVSTPKARVPPSRENTKSLTVHVPEAVRRQVKMLAVEQGRNMDDVVSEALNLIFVKYRKPEIAPRKGGSLS